MKISNMTLTEIIKYIDDIKDVSLVSNDIIEALGSDPRVGVRRLLEKINSRRTRYSEEKKRLEELWLFEKQYLDQGARIIAGTDEAGRGPLAGPVVAAAVVLPFGLMISRLNDSKKLSPTVREELADAIKETAVSWSVGLASVEEIYEFNIYSASMLAMKRAIRALDPSPDQVLVDGYPIPGLDLPQKGIVGGDSKSASIAAASILAKVTRDRLMSQIHRLYPKYGFDQHKGYGTKGHLEALSCFGPCPYHRKDFAPVRTILEIRQQG
ncbi:MAG: ribonuclease HII [Peptococcaceae bacterium]|nr:ribonuclease HII [Peptococcaceae bacterium]